MSPDELKAAAYAVERGIDYPDNLRNVIAATRRLADVIEYAESVDIAAQVANSQWLAGAGTGRGPDGRDVALKALRIARGETSERRASS